jgi:hypothetical protein
VSGDRNLAMLVGNGLSIAFSDQLLLTNISKEMTSRFTAEYTGSDAVAKAMQNVAKHQSTGRLQAETIEEAFGWELGSGASNGLIIDRSGAFGLASSPNWTSFIFWSSRTRKSRSLSKAGGRAKSPVPVDRLQSSITFPVKIPSRT